MSGVTLSKTRQINRHVNERESRKIEYCPYLRMTLVCWTRVEASPRITKLSRGCSTRYWILTIPCRRLHHCKGRDRVSNAHFFLRSLETTGSITWRANAHVAFFGTTLPIRKLPQLPHNADAYGMMQLEVSEASYILTDVVMHDMCR